MLFEGYGWKINPDTTRLISYRTVEVSNDQEAYLFKLHRTEVFDDLSDLAAELHLMYDLGEYTYLKKNSEAKAERLKEFVKMNFITYEDNEKDTYY